MATSVFVLPIVPGKEDFDRESLQQMAAPGSQHDAYVEARRAQGVAREAGWHQRTPKGTFAIVLMEGDDLDAAMGAMIAGQSSTRARYRAHRESVAPALGESPSPADTSEQPPRPTWLPATPGSRRHPAQGATRS